MSIYEFTPLRVDEIRVLELLPGTDERPVHVLLRTLRLPTIPSTDSDTTDEYEAVSYAWGDPTLKHRITVDKSHEFAITESLYTLLCHLRLPNGIRRLWVDALCINQSDLREKSVQVAQMGKIYTCSTRTVVWLGPSEGLDWVAFAMMDLELRWKTPKKQPRLDWFQDHILEYRHGCRCCPVRSFSNRDEMLAAVWQGLKVLYARSWFSRLWIVQEIVLARKTIVQSGSHVVDGHTFFMLTTRVNGDPQFLPEYVAQGGSFRSIERTSSLISRIGRGQHLPRYGDTVSEEGCNCTIEALNSFCGQLCGNPLDRVFALRDMTCANSWQGLMPDYSLSAIDLYTRFVGECLERCSGYRWDQKLREFENRSTVHPSWSLAMAGSMKMIERGDGWPSWVPDLHNVEKVHSRYSPQYHGNRGPFESYKMECTARTLSHSTLTVKGRSFAEVLEVVPNSQLLRSGMLLAGRNHSESADLPWSTRDDGDFNLGWNLAMLDLALADEVDKSTFFAWKSRCGACFINHGFAWTETYLSEDDDRRLWFAQRNNHLFNCLSAPDDEDLDVTLDRTRDALMVDSAELLVAIQPERCLAALRMSDGVLFGWVPETARAGDKACILYGAPFPFVVRPLAGTDGYKLVGDCVVVGLDEHLALGPDVAKTETIWLM